MILSAVSITLLGMGGVFFFIVFLIAVLQLFSAFQMNAQTKDKSVVAALLTVMLKERGK